MVWIRDPRVVTAARDEFLTVLEPGEGLLAREKGLIAVG